ncbi:hypothetical protein TSUD_193830 [Trifolium subterraneum]|uniref:ADP/ATP translocase n=1 Tax=Trifolium subterraneum TaxID=3900 RepID=A0A2Z6LQT9_TRISU|nr:hypothetical protein TSUD_193830 [Trifolium subterraneum]
MLRYSKSLSVANWKWIFTYLSNFKAMSTCSFFAEEAQLTPLLRLGAGACAGIIAMSATYPMDLVRGCLTVQILYVGLKFSVYESLKDWLIQTKPLGIAHDSELSVTTRLACGAAAGTIGQTVAYPLDVIRRRTQMGGWKDAASIVSADGKGIEYTGMADAFRKTNSKV